MTKETIETLKKKFWKQYTPLINNNFDAFELMRKIGVEQGRYLEQERILKILKEHIKWLLEIKEFNAHDSAWIDETIKRFKQMEKQC